MKTLAQIEKVMHLRSVDLFSHCSAEEIIRIAAIAGERRFEEGEGIYETNDSPDAIYCVVEGQVELRSGHSTKERLGAQQTFGVREILSGRLRTMQATASQPTVALAIEADDFFDLLSNNIDIVKALFREILGQHSDGSGEGS